MPKYTKYVVYRHGSNAANQSMCNKRIVGTIKATSRKEACKLMAGRVTVCHNQRLEAVPASKLVKTGQQIAYGRDIEQADLGYNVHQQADPVVRRYRRQLHSLFPYRRFGLEQYETHYRILELEVGDDRPVGPWAACPAEAYRTAIDRMLDAWLEREGY